MIVIILIEKLNYSNVTNYEKYLFSLSIEEINMNNEGLIAYGAKYNNIPCGAIFGELSESDKTVCDIKSFFVSSLFRKNGVGTELLNILKNEAIKLSVEKIIFKAITSEENINLINDFFSKRGFSKVELLTAVYRFTPETIIKNNQFVRLLSKSNFKLPEKVKILPIKDVNPILLEKVRKKQGINYPENLSPFANEFDLKEKCTFFAVYDDKEIVGWMTGFEAPGNIILYRTLFVREDYRQSALGYFIFSECIKYHRSNHMNKKALCAIGLNNEKADRFVSLYFKDMYDHKKYEFQTELNI